MGKLGWACPKCGNFNVGVNKCEKCGHEVLPVTPKPIQRTKQDKRKPKGVYS